jgi:Predicted transcriptional regulators
MLINDTCKITGLTKKALTYYEEQALVTPCILENGYRDYSPNDIDRLKKIAVLRKLGLGTKEIKIILNDNSGNVIKNFSVVKELDIRRAAVQKTLLDRLASGESYEIISTELTSLEGSASITQRLMEVFPGYFGSFICLHFAHFLNAPVVTDTQKSAYAEIVNFLDNIPSPEFSLELQDYLDEQASYISTQNFNEMHTNTLQAIENIDGYLQENRAMLEEYLRFKKSDEYKSSPAYVILSKMKDSLQTSGYYDVFIPAMKRLSISYAEFHEKILSANELFLMAFPDAECASE